MPPAGWGAPPMRPVVPDPVIQQPLAPWWKRLVAILIDGAVLGFGYFVIFLGFGVAVGHRSVSSSPSTPSQSSAGVVIAGLIVLWLIASLPATFYYGVMNGSRRGQTLGKMALSIAVRDARTGGAIGFWRGLGRQLMVVVFMVALYVPYVIDSLAPLWDARRQSWHDKVAHTVVVDLNP